MKTLPQAIDFLYEAFGDIPKPRVLDACPCCLDEKEVSALLSGPLRQLSPGDLSAYASSAFLTAGDVPDYLYFLPRIMEVSIMETGWWPDPEVTGRAISNTKPEFWPPHRANALRGLLHSLLASLMEREDTGYAIDSWLCAIGRTGLDVRPFLAQLQTDPARVQEYYVENAARLNRRKLSNTFWEPEDPGYAQILDWFGSEAVGDIVLKACGVALYFCLEETRDGDPPAKS